MHDDFHFEYYSSLKQRTVDWLWYPYIPYGKLTILQGDPGEGKSTFMLNIAALLSKGKQMPDGFKTAGPQTIVYQTAEDDLSDTVKPRLIVAGADCNRIAYIIEEDSPLTIDDSRIQRILEQTKARLFILDPLQAYLAQESDLTSAGRMRQQLRALSNLAAKNNCAIVLIGHMNKSSGEKSIYRGLGSIDIAAIARSVLMIVRDKDDPSIRYMLPIKSSLAPEGEAIAFCFDNNSGIRWIGHKTVDPKQYEDVQLDDNKTALAERIIKELLSSHDLKSNDILKKLQIMGISSRTTYSVKQSLHVSSYKKEGVWFWHMEKLS